MDEQIKRIKEELAKTEPGTEKYENLLKDLNKLTEIQKTKVETKSVTSEVASDVLKTVAKCVCTFGAIIAASFITKKFELIIPRDAGLFK